MEESLIHRAAILLAFLSDLETFEELTASGVRAELAYLAVKAAVILNGV
jgi:hypothetical protein